MYIYICMYIYYVKDAFLRLNFSEHCLLSRQCPTGGISRILPVSPLTAIIWLVL